MYVQYPKASHMQFKIRLIKKNEFESSYLNIRAESKIKTAGLIATFNHDMDGEYVTVIIEDAIISKFTPEQIAKLKTIK